MPLSRSNRIDRRRRVMLDAVAADSEFAVESVRARKRSRARENSDSPTYDEFSQKYRDPGYSQAVRRACQQRMVQLIPVRRGTLSIVLSCMWMLWGALLFSHYWIFTRPALQLAGGSAQAAGFSSLPIAQLFNLRSPHSIAQWLTCQLWALTAVAAWMIFQLRRHKLDDYRARYRIWVALAIAAAFSSFEASSSGLMLLGMSIDGWAKREIGYAGWPLVLATFASIIGVIGIRLCSELKSAPMSVVSWLFGLLAWALAALLGTGLLKLTWSQATVDLVVGGSLLGGILAVFQASGIYLRQTYIHAQKRFLVRNGANLQPIRWKVPKLSLRRKRAEETLDERVEPAIASDRPKWKMPWSRKRSQHTDALEQSTPDRSMDKSNKEAKPRGRLFGFIPQRQELNEKLDAEPIREDDGPMQDKGLTKKRGWFGIGGNKDAEADSSAAFAASQSSSKIASPVKAESKSRDDYARESIPSEKKSVSSQGSSQVSAYSFEPKPKIESEAGAAKAKSGWISKFSKSQQALDTVAENPSAKQSALPMKQQVTKATPGAVKEEAKAKKSWFSFTAKKPKEPQEQKPVIKKVEKAIEGDIIKKARRGLFGMLDGLKLKPPTDESSKQDSAPLTRPIPIKQGQQIPSTQSDADDDEGDDDYSGRPMSKADRKKLRRQSQDDRRAA